MVFSEEVKVIFPEYVPTGGLIDGLVKENVPLTGSPFSEATPPLNIELANDWPDLIGLAVGTVVILIGVLEKIG